MKIILSIPDYTLINGKPHLIPWCKAYFLIKAFNEKGHETLTHFSSLFEENKRISILKRIQKNKIGRVPVYLIQKIVEKQVFNDSGKQLIKQVKAFSPDIIIFHDKSFFNGDILKKIKNLTNAKLIFAIGTSALTLARKDILDSAPLFDYIFTSDYYHAITWLELGAKNASCLPISACNPEYHFEPIFSSSIEKDKYKSDVSFVGRLLPKYHDERTRYLIKLAMDFKLSIWTPSYNTINKHKQLQKCFKGNVQRENMIKAIGGSKISLNFHSDSVRGGGNIRLFEIPATNTLQIVDRYSPEWFIEGKEIVSFNSYDDLKNKINFYLDSEDERIRIANMGQERVYKDHTFTNRIEKMLSILQNK